MSVAEARHKLAGSFDILLCPYKNFFRFIS